MAARSLLTSHHSLIVSCRRQGLSSCLDVGTQHCHDVCSWTYVRRDLSMILPSSYVCMIASLLSNAVLSNAAINRTEHLTP
ncbi:hypothetical protein CONLIGDRAFT_274058 [Coniochaeta ligniaria NRRL 30616]|uniref:Uncharacterized protein n=1 Tax=Coniochaeta ligniaria NRRL 30616 TaxID=1408157 RepID=A0A1J7IZ45_9PEZI|nr:hypothetical protein CONLIGDRAFT_274058 [Coniochaeta ligniaria NRRL 30616]